MSFRRLLHHLNRRDTRLLPKLNYPLILTLIVVALFASSTLFHLASLRAANSDPIQEIQGAMKSGGNMEAWHSDSINTTLVKTANLLVGDIPSQEDLKQKIENGKAYVPGGAIGGVSGMIASTYAPPASGVEYIAQLKNNFLGVKTAYAQGAGTGWSGLQPILNIWRGFRNLVYVVTSLVFIFLGVMIMLRVKTSPQTVVAIQNAVPQIITTLLLVTFSYAIAGLLIDFTYLFQGLAVAVLFQVSNLQLGDNLLTHIIPGTYNFSNLANPSMGTMWDLTFRAVPMWMLMWVSGIIGAIIGSIGGPGIGTLLGAGIGAIVILLVMAILVFIWMIQLYFGLIKAYIHIILKIILAPLEIGLGAFPGSKAGFSTWIIDLIANLAVFPISFLFLLLANLIIQNVSQYGLWAPKMISDAGLLSGIINVFGWPQNGGLLPIGLGIITVSLAAKLPELVPQAIFMLKPSAWETAIGSATNINNMVSGAAEKYKNYSLLTGAAMGSIGKAKSTYRNYQERMERESVRRANPNVPQGKPQGRNNQINNAKKVAEEAQRESI